MCSNLLAFGLSCAITVIFSLSLPPSPPSLPQVNVNSSHWCVIVGGGGGDVTTDLTIHWTNCYSCGVA